MNIFAESDSIWIQQGLPGFPDWLTCQASIEVSTSGQSFPWVDTIQKPTNQISRFWSTKAFINWCPHHQTSWLQNLRKRVLVFRLFFHWKRKERLGAHWFSMKTKEPCCGLPGPSTISSKGNCQGELSKN